MEPLQPRLERMLPLGILAQLSPRTYTYIWWDDPVLRLALNVMGRAIHAEIVPTHHERCTSLELNVRWRGKPILDVDVYRIAERRQRYDEHLDRVLVLPAAPAKVTIGLGIWTPLISLNVSTKKRAGAKRTFGGSVTTGKHGFFIDHPAS